MAKEDNAHWIPIADMMSGLMAIFLFIAVSYMSKSQEKTRGYLDLRGEMFADLQGEFQADLEQWNAEIDEESLTIRFKSLDTLFETGNAKPRPEFLKIIRDFFPRYAKLLYKAKYRNKIEEIRIEGHTSSIGFGRHQSREASYAYNLQLSQDRSRNVLLHSLASVNKNNRVSTWLRANLTANGLSFSKTLTKIDGSEDFIRSKRVEFRVKLKADQVIKDIIANAN